MDDEDPAHFTTEFTIARFRYSFDVQLSICMQHDLEEYIEPIQGDPSTYENEHRSYAIGDYGLLEWVSRAESKAAEYRLSAENVIAAVRMGISYADMHRIVTGEEPNEQFSRKPFEADEDLMFIYERLHALHSFIFFAKEELDELDRERKETGEEEWEAATTEFDSPGEPPF